MSQPADSQPLLPGSDSGHSGHQHGLTVLTTAIFAVGEMAGAGVLALPFSMVGTGYTGVVINILCAFVSAYTGMLLGKCWMMVLERHEEHRENSRSPYPTIGQVTFGTPGRLIVSCSINITLFGVSVVFLLLASENVQSLVREAGADMSYCYWLLIVAGAIAPLVWLGSPADFWFVGYAAVGATTIACVVCLANIIYDHTTSSIPVFYPNLNFTDFFMAFGTICFAYGGHPAFPTFQADMKEPEKFGKAIFLAYFIVLLMYLPVAIAGYSVYGSLVDSNVLNTVSGGAMRDIVQCLITVHLFCGFIIVVNPVCQELEELINIPKQFNIKRVLFRTLMVGVVLFMAETIPQFGPILSLIGGSTTTLLAYILPPVFFLKMAYMNEVAVTLHVKVACVQIVCLGLLAGVASTYSAIQELADFAPMPCYVNMTTSK